MATPSAASFDVRVGKRLGQQAALSVLWYSIS